MLQKTFRSKSFYRTFYFAPVVTSSVAVAAIWLWLFNPEISPLNSFLRSVGLPAPDWLQNPKTVIPSFAIVGIWQGLGYQVVMFMAGLESISKSMYEAADVDGANERQKLRKITIPLLSPTILFLSITSIIGSFQVFDYIYVFLDTTAPAARPHHRLRDRQHRVPRVQLRRRLGDRRVPVRRAPWLTGLQLAAQKRWVHYTE